MTADLLPCPFCGGKNMRYEPTEQSIFCIRCGATGPYKHFPYSPDEIWNTRHEPDELPEWLKDAIQSQIDATIGVIYGGRFANQRTLKRNGGVEALEWVLSLRKTE